MQRRLIRAGIRNPNALKLLYGSKVFWALAAAGGHGLGGGRFRRRSEQQGRWPLRRRPRLGFFGPNEYVNRRVRQRQKQIRRGLPNALDLLVVCVESGLGLDQAIVQVAKELGSTRTRRSARNSPW